MPRIYRVMAAEDGRPLVARRSDALGVRVSGENPGEQADVFPDEDGRVHPGNGGMSVNPSLRQIHLGRVPRRLRHLVAGARGPNRCSVWSMGNGEFVSASVTPNLHLRPDPEPAAHGYVEPSESMELVAYEKALAATRDQWVISEE